MKQGTRSSSSTLGITVAAVAAVALFGLVVWWVLGHAKSNPEPTANTAPQTVTTEQVRQAQHWPTYHSGELGVRLVLPTGLTPCRKPPSTFELRTDACGSATPATVTVHRDDSLSTLTPSAAFDQVFAQELREAGRDSVSALQSSSGATATGGTILQASVSDTITGVIVSKGTTSDNRVLAVTVRRDRSFTPPGSDLGFDEVVSLILQSIEFTVGSSTAQ